MRETSTHTVAMPLGHTIRARRRGRRRARSIAPERYMVMKPSSSSTIGTCVADSSSAPISVAVS